ncbi:MAG: radical SAM protein [archaeon]|nr:radical SAM protein [archaeon]
MNNLNNNERKGISIIGIVPQYSKSSRHNIYTKVRMPPVGIISVLSQIPHNPEINVYAIDENNYSGPRDFLGQPDHVFLQSRTPAKIAMFYGGMSNSIPRGFSLAQQYKGFGALTMIGGSHVDALPDEALHSGADIVVHGEGEKTAEEILGIVLRDGKVEFDKERLSKVRGISYLDGDRKVFTGKREPIKNLDELQSPDLTLIRHLEKKWSAIPISRGRGCNYSCEFCVVNDLYGPYKSRSIEKTLQDVAKYIDLGYRNFFFTDDNFAQNPGETISLCRNIEDYVKEFKRKQKPSFIVQVRNEVAENDELMDAMKVAGVTTLAIGYESPINEELKSMKKGVTVEKLVERSRKLAKHFYLHGMFIFGYPTFEDSKYKSELTLEMKAKAYKKFFKEAKLDTVQVLNAVPLPGSRLRAKLEKEGRIFPLQTVGWGEYGGNHLCYNPSPEGLDAYELQNLPRILMKDWYLGNFMNRTVNFGNWINWAYNASIGFPIQFGAYYTGRFLHNLVEKKREKRFSEETEPQENIFSETLSNTWGDIKRRWRNLGARTYGGAILRNYYKTYNKSRHAKLIEEVVKKK